MRTSTQDLKLAIVQSLKAFEKGSLRANATLLFNTLGYTSEKTIELSPNTPENFLQEVDQHNRLRRDKALFSKWKNVDFIFQITGEEIKAGGSRLMAGDLANVNAAVKGVADAKRQFFDVPGAHSGVLASTKTKGAKR